MKIGLGLPMAVSRVDYRLIQVMLAVIARGIICELAHSTSGFNVVAHACLNSF